MSHRQPRPPSGDVRRGSLLAGLLAASVLVPVLARGGYTPTSRAIFTALAGAALFGAIAADERRVIRFGRAPAVLVMSAIAALSLVSAAWTIAGVDVTFRAGLVVAGYAAVTVAAAVATSRGGLRMLVAVMAGTAALAALVGIAGAAFRVEPYAERIGGHWRPGGPFEYPPALALLQVCALPGLLKAMSDGRRVVAAAGAAGAALAGGVLVLAASRGQLVIAIAVLAIAVIASRRTLECPRPVAAGATALIAAAGIGFQLLEGGWVPRSETGGDGVRLFGSVALVAAAAAIWTFIREPLSAVRMSIGRRGFAAAAAALVLAAALAVPVIEAGGGLQPRGGLGHGRIDVWRGAVRTVDDRPFAGAGADAYFVASRANQEGRLTRFAHNLPLEFAVELGVLGAVLALALYGACLTAVWRARRAAGAFLVAPAVIAFLAANAYDWSWHQAGAGAVFALALGALLAQTDPPGQLMG